MNTKTPRAIYAHCRACIEHAAALLEKKFYESLCLNPVDAEAFVLRIHEEAPRVLKSRYKGDWNDFEAVRRFVYCYFNNKLLHMIRKARQEQNYRVFGEAADKIIENASTTMRVGETPSELNLAVLAELLLAAPDDVRDLCLGFLRYGKWRTASKRLKWHDKKCWRVVAKAKLFFEKNAIWNEGFLELRESKDE